VTKLSKHTTMAGDCSGRGCTYVWWGNPGMRVFSIITFIMFILGIILTGVGYSQQTCPSGYTQVSCTSSGGATYDCTGPAGPDQMCADMSCPSDSVCSAGDTLLSIASFIIFIQLCRLCCCATPYYVGGPMPVQQPVIMATVVAPNGQVMSPQAVPYGQPMYAAGYQPYGGGQGYAYPTGSAPPMGQPMGQQQMGQPMGQPMGAQPMQMGMGAPAATYAYVQQGSKPEPPMAGQPQPYQYPGQGYTMEGAPQQQPAPAYVGQPAPYTTSV